MVFKRFVGPVGFMRFLGLGLQHRGAVSNTETLLIEMPELYDNAGLSQIQKGTNLEQALSFEFALHAHYIEGLD